MLSLSASSHRFQLHQNLLSNAKVIISALHAETRVTHIARTESLHSIVIFQTVAGSISRVDAPICSSGTHPAIFRRFSGSRLRIDEGTVDALFTGLLTFVVLIISTYTEPQAVSILSVCYTYTFKNSITNC